MERTYSFSATVRGYHYHCKYWIPVENEKLICMHEPRNCFDRFAIKVMKENGEIVGHLSRKISRVIKHFLDRGVTMYCELTSTRYRRSLLVRLS